MTTVVPLPAPIVHSGLCRTRVEFPVPAVHRGHGHEQTTHDPKPKPNPNPKPKPKPKPNPNIRIRPLHGPMWQQQAVSECATGDAISDFDQKSLDQPYR